MKIDITGQKKNPFLDRTEIMINILHHTQPTPTNAAIQQVVARELGKEPEYVDIRSVFSRRGIGESVAKIFVWKEPKAKNLEKEAAAKQQAAEKPAEAVESPKEEAKSE